MKSKLFTLILACIILQSSNLSGSGQPLNQIEKPIKITTSFAPNYLWHLMAAAQISYSSEYATRYKHTIDPADLAFLKEHAPFLAFGEGNSGPFTWLLIFLPSYLDLTDKDEFEEYFSLVIKGLNTFDFTDLQQRYTQANWKDPFIEISSGIFYLPQEYHERVREITPLFKKFVQVILNNINNYQNQVWDQAQKSMQHNKDTLSRYFAANDIVKRWEDAMHKPFEADYYEIILCYACQYGPNANSLSYDKNVFYYDYSLDHTIEFISHETGIRILFQQYLKLYEEDLYDPGELYAAYESLLMWYNKKVLNNQQLSYRLMQFRDEHFHQIYDSYYTPEASPLFLLETALQK